MSNNICTLSSYVDTLCNGIKFLENDNISGPKTTPEGLSTFWDVPKKLFLLGSTTMIIDHNAVKEKMFLVGVIQLISLPVIQLVSVLRFANAIISTTINVIKCIIKGNDCNLNKDIIKIARKVVLIFLSIPAHTIVAIWNIVHPGLKSLQLTSFLEQNSKIPLSRIIDPNLCTLQVLPHSNNIQHRSAQG